MQSVIMQSVIMQSVIMQSVIMQSVIMQSVIMQSDILQSVIMLSVLKALFKHLKTAHMHKGKRCVDQKSGHQLVATSSQGYKTFFLRHRCFAKIS